MRPLVFLAFILFLSFPLRAEELQVAAFENPPYLINNQFPSGLHAKLAEAVFTHAGLPIKLHFSPQARAISDFTEGLYPILLGTPLFLRASDPPCSFVPLFKVRILFFYSKQRHPNFTWKKWSDLKGYRISDIISGVAIPMLEDNKLTWELSSSFETLFLKLKYGRIDLAVGTDLGGYNMIEQVRGREKDLAAYVDTPILDIDVGILIGTGPDVPKDLLPALSRGLAECMKDGDWDKIMKEYYQTNPIPLDSRKLIERYIHSSSF